MGDLARNSFSHSSHINPSTNCIGLQRMSVRSSDSRGEQLSVSFNCHSVSLSFLAFLFVFLKWENIKNYSHRIVGKIKRINMETFLKIKKHQKFINISIYYQAFLVLMKVCDSSHGTPLPSPRAISFHI